MAKEYCIHVKFIQVLNDNIVIPKSLDLDVERFVRAKDFEEKRIKEIDKNNFNEVN
jgi:hypothetical protein